MKKIYEKPSIRVEEFCAEDIIRTSGGGLQTTSMELEYSYDNIFTVVE